jgi:hypothetical protein
MNTQAETEAPAPEAVKTAKERAISDALAPFLPGKAPWKRRKKALALISQVMNFADEARWHLSQLDTNLSRPGYLLPEYVATLPPAAEKWLGELWDAFYALLPVPPVGEEK